MFGILRKRLANKIMVAIVLTIVLIITSEIVVRIYFGTKDRIELMNMLAWDLASSIYSGIKYPMSVGDSDAIKKQLSDIKWSTADVEVYICDFNQNIIYSTDSQKLNTTIADTINDREALSSLTEVLKTGIKPQKPFEDKISGRSYLTSFYPILNRQECFHCHGSSRKILGGMVIKVGA
jgi:hypothetical protein